MTSKEEDAAYSVLLDRQITELEERLAALTCLIPRLLAEGVDTANQVSLLEDMAHAVKTVEQFREELRSGVGADFGAPSPLP